MKYECLENHDNIRLEFIIMKLHVLNLNLHIHFTANVATKNEYLVSARSKCKRLSKGFIGRDPVLFSTYRCLRGV